jgi:predicted nucleotidyltransferase
MTAPLTQQPPYLSEVVNRIVQKFHPVKIILFGSWARGTAREDSDIDLLVVLPKVEHTRKAAIQIGNSLSNLPISKDIVVTTPKDIEKYGKTVGYILLPALREGKVIYERE